MQNWAGNVTFNAARVERPTSLAQLQDIVRQSPKARVVGTGHSFNPIADTDGTLISLRDMPRIVEVDTAAQCVRVDGGATYEDVAPILHGAGFALAALASLPSITLAGAVSTATHGSGDRNRNLSAAVRSLTLVTANGDLATFDRSHPDFAGMVVGLGAMGVVCELTLDVVRQFDIRQNIYLDLPVPSLLADFDGAMSAAYSVSLFTRWQGDVVDQLWIKALDTPEAPVLSFMGARAADRAVHPLPGGDGSRCTIQLGEAGPWHERLFHFPIGSISATGAELQSEFFVQRQDAAAAFAALHAVQDRISGPLFISEIRTIAADDLWLSSAYGQESVGFHCTWKPQWDAVIAAVKVIEATLAPFAPRPHWGKVYTVPAAEVRSRYPRMADFAALVQRLDPEAKFRNDFVDTLLNG